MNLSIHLRRLLPDLNVRHRRALGAAFVLGVLAPAHAASEPSLITGEKKSYAYTWQEEVKLGTEADQELVRELGVYDDQRLQAYVQAVGERVLAHSTFANPTAPEIYRGTKFTFRVIDSPVVNAFALPGGFVYVTRGLLSHVLNEAQLAVVLGHEIAHVAGRHSSQQARGAQWGQLGTVLGAILGQRVLGDQVPDASNTLFNTGGRAMQMFMLKYSREAEHESDELGVQYATLAGYAAGESARLFDTLQTLASEQGRALPTWQTTHPDPGDRSRRVVEQARKTPQERADNVGQEQLLRHIDGLIVGEDPRAGFAQRGVFYHPTLRFQMNVAPGWKMENQRSAVLFAEPEGKGVMGLRIADGARARDAAGQFVQQSKLQVTASGDTQVNGLPTSVVVGRIDTERGSVGVWNAFIEMENRVYSLLGYAPENEFNPQRSTFESVAASFSPLRVPNAASVQPARLKLIRVDREGPLASFLPTALPPDLTADAVAKMNQLNLNDRVPAGRVIKIVDAPPRPEFNPAVATGAPATPPPNSGYPSPGTSYPPAGQPQTGYPPPQGSPGSTSYPPGTGQPGQPGQSPTAYPPQGYPNYPPSQPTTQPAYPPSNYPPQTYPPQTYPQGGATYPGGTGNPPAQGYPPAYPGSGYPPPAQPGQPSPSGSGTGYPPPQFPQPGSPNASPPPASPPWPSPGANQGSGPVWPR